MSVPEIKYIINNRQVVIWKRKSLKLREPVQVFNSLNLIICEWQIDDFRIVLESLDLADFVERQIQPHEIDQFFQPLNSLKMKLFAGSWINELTSILLLSICSFVRLLNCHRFSILMIFWKSRRRTLTEAKGIPSSSAILPASPRGP